MSTLSGPFSKADNKASSEAMQVVGSRQSGSSESALAPPDRGDKESKNNTS